MVQSFEVIGCWYEIDVSWTLVIAVIRFITFHSRPPEISIDEVVKDLIVWPEEIVEFSNNDRIHVGVFSSFASGQTLLVTFFVDAVEATRLVVIEIFTIL